MKRVIDGLYKDLSCVKNCKLSNKEKKELNKKRRKLKFIEEKSNNDKIFFNDYNSEYYYENGLRKVKPYMFNYKTFCKERWFLKTIPEVYQHDFNLSLNLIKTSISKGNILINGDKIDESYKLRQGDVITHNMHRHETPVTAEKPRFIGYSNGLLALFKPAGIPVHPTGSYRMNSMLGLLIKDPINIPGLDMDKLGKPRIVHRLDCNVSGVLLLAVNYSACFDVLPMIQNKIVDKFYLAQVIGRFPDSSPNQSIRVRQPLGSGPIPKFMGINMVVSEAEGGKSSETQFIKLDYDSETDTSMVLCRPITGRTHQIRIHLQYLGHPIINDNLYNSESWGPNKGKDGVYGRPIEELIDGLRELCRPKRTGIDGLNTECVWELQDDCDRCEAFNGKEEYDPKSMVMNLHSHRYRFRGVNEWDFVAPFPEWVLDWKGTLNTIQLTETITKLTDNDSMINVFGHDSKLEITDQIANISQSETEQTEEIDQNDKSELAENFLESEKGESNLTDNFLQSERTGQSNQ